MVSAADDITGVAMGVTQAGHMTAPDRGAHPRSLLLRRGRPQITLGTLCHGPFWVESECGAVTLGQACVLPPLSFGGALVARP